MARRPEWEGYCEASHDLIPVKVKVMSIDICYAGLPGCDSTLRVRKLEVLE